MLKYVEIVFFNPYSNWGTEKEEGEPYHNGNSDPRGFGKNCQWSEDLFLTNQITSFSKTCNFNDCLAYQILLQY